MGLSVHRPDPVDNAISEVHVWKCRFSWVGKQGVAELFFNPVTSRYSIGGEDNFPDVPSYNFEDVPF